MGMIQYVIHEGASITTPSSKLRASFATFTEKHKDFVGRMVDKMRDDKK